MIDHPIQLIQEIIGDEQSAIFRARSESAPANENREVIEIPTKSLSFLLKLNRSAFPSEEDKGLMKQELAFATAIDSPLVLQHREIVKWQNDLALVLEEFGENLRDVLQRGDKISLDDFLGLALSMTQGVEDVHRRDILHRNIRPESFFVKKNNDAARLGSPTYESRLCDFRYALQLTPISQGVRASGDLSRASGLAYISPEQTGRMNRMIDQRSDLYSLGVVFYEILAGRPPFESKDAIELVHSHIARRPVELTTLRPDLPAPLARLVMKLLAKSAEDRYQSTRGLIADLNRFAKEIEERGEISEDTPLGQDDQSPRFRIPQKLFGREKDFAALENSFQGIRAGVSAFALVAGYAGIGKSALIHELRRPVAEANGFFAEGKYDQYQRNIPFAGVAMALRDVVRQILKEDTARVERWKISLLTELRNSGQVIVDILPELERLIGKQPTLPQLTAAEAQNRFNFTFIKFLGALANAEHPLVLFLDDLQWADSGSLDLLRLCIESDEIGHLLLVGAYRDNEVSAEHPLTLLTDDLERHGHPIARVILNNLTGEHVLALLTHMLAGTSSSPSVADEQLEALGELSRIAVRKTDGNPFYLLQFLQSLYEEGLLVFDRSVYRWRWSISEIESRQITENVVDFLVRKLERLPSETQRMLQLGACIGSRFRLNTLTFISDFTIEELAAGILAALREGLVLDTHGKLQGAVQSMSASEADVLQLGFLHDRVQQASYALIDEKQRSDLHLKIGELLWSAYDAEVSAKQPTEKLTTDGTPQYADDARIFEIVNQFERGRDNVKGESESLMVAQMNFRAGLRAENGSAYDAGYRYFTAARELLPTSAWLDHYRLSLDTHLHQAECACQISKYDTVEEIAKIVFERIPYKGDPNDPKVLDRAVMYSCRIRSRINTNYHEGVQFAFDALRELGLTLPATLSKRHVVQKVVATAVLLLRKTVFSRKSIGDLALSADLQNPRKRAITQLIDAAGTGAYNVNQNAFSMWVLELVQIALRDGHCPESSPSLIMFGTILAFGMGRLQAGKELGKLTLTLADRYEHEGRSARGRLLHYTHMETLIHYRRDTREPIKRCVERAYEEGDTEYGVLAAYSLLTFSFHSGLPIKEVKDVLKYTRAAIGRTGNSGTLFSANLVGMFVDQMTAAPPESDNVFRGDLFSEATVEHVVNGKQAYTTACFLHYRALVGHYFGRFDQSLKEGMEADTYFQSLLGEEATFSHCFTYACALLIAPAATRTETKKRRAKTQKLLKKIASWAGSCPKNFLHQRYILSAELARQIKDYEGAFRYYELAIKTSIENEYLPECAFANERAATLYYELHRNTVANAYLQEARYYYAKWGATGKVEALERAYPHLKRGTDNRALKAVGADGQESAVGHIVDVETVLRASEALAGEIVLEELLKKLMRVVIENAGAERGVLLLDRNGVLSVEAEANSANTEATVLPGRSLDNYTTLPKSVIQYVHNVHETALVNEPAAQGMFMADDYIQREQPRSVLGVPLIHQGNLTGILYLENRLAAEAFTAERVQILNVLSSQAAISIENSMLYRNLETTNSLLRESNQVLDKTNTAYRRFVPREFLELLSMGDITEIKLGDQIQKEMTIMFCDIRGFTTLSEAMSPKENFDFLNSLLRMIGPVVRQNNGFIDKYIGDSILSLFPGSPEDALNASIATCQVISRFNQARIESGREPVRMGFGIHTGLLMLGTIGERERMEGTVISDAVNLASRIESLTKHFHATVFISEEALSKIPLKDRYATRHIGKIRVKGKSQPVSLIQILDAEPEHEREHLLKSKDIFETGLQAYLKKDFAAAACAFEQALHRESGASGAKDHASIRYLEDSRNFLNTGVPFDWEGTIVMHSK